MKTQIFYIAAAIIFLIECSQNCLAQDTEADLRKAILNAEDITSFRRAVDAVFKANKPEVLVQAISNPNSGGKSEMIQALGKFPRHDCAQGLAQILGVEALWVHVRGGRGQDVQDDFVSTLKEVSLKVCGLDFSHSDLFNSSVRQNAILALSAK